MRRGDPQSVTVLDCGLVEPTGLAQHTGESAVDLGLIGSQLNQAPSGRFRRVEPAPSKVQPYQILQYGGGSGEAPTVGPFVSRDGLVHPRPLLGERLLPPAISWEPDLVADLKRGEQRPTPPNVVLDGRTMGGEQEKHRDRRNKSHR